mmetsp:Transcript_59322/g.157933  ORF Transcript_59322/g.157933 Transcript_59322/m.157933 type:complete len:238 (+) Transcript_59322:1332-2045(+)
MLEGKPRRNRPITAITSDRYLLRCTCTLSPHRRINSKPEVDKAEVRQAIGNVQQDVSWSCISMIRNFSHLIESGDHLRKESVRESASICDGTARLGSTLRSGMPVLLQISAELISWKPRHRDPVSPCTLTHRFRLLGNETWQTAWRSSPTMPDVVAALSGGKTTKQLAFELSVCQSRRRPAQHFFNCYFSVHCTLRRPHNAEASLPKRSRDAEGAAIDVHNHARSKLIWLGHWFPWS